MNSWPLGCLAVRSRGLKTPGNRENLSTKARLGAQPDGASGFFQTQRELGCEGQPQASSDILLSRGVCLSPTSGLQDVIYAALIGVGLIGSPSSHMCWEGARESIKGSLHITGGFLHLLAATSSPPLYFREPGHSSMRWELFLGIPMKPDKMVVCA